MELRPNTVVLAHDAHTVQIGGDPAHHLVLTDLTAEARRWLETLSRRSFQRPGARRPESITPPDGSAHLIRTLRSAGFLAPRHSGPEAPAVLLDGVDGVSLSALRTIALHGPVRVEVRTRGRVGAALAEHLGTHALGRSAHGAVVSHIGSWDLPVHVGRVSRPDLVVLTRSRSIDHAASGLLMSADLAHLPIIHDEFAVRIGPLVVPGRTPCLNCMARAMSAENSNRPRVEAKVRSLDVGVRPGLMRDAASADVARRVLAFLALGATMHSEHGVVVRIDEDGRSTQHLVRTSPRCGCTGAALLAPPGPGRWEECCPISAVRGLAGFEGPALRDVPDARPPRPVRSATA